MNFGDCPYEGCNGLLFVPVPEHTPAYTQVVCDTCKRPVWYKCSRLDPEAFTEADFERQYRIEGERVVRREEGK
jgi:hypothetical protein